MNQNTLFNLDTIPEAAPEAKQDKRRWYISVMYEGKEFVLIATHMNMPNEWAEVGTFKHQPHLYKTSAGARRQGVSYVRSKGSVTVKEWKGW